MIHIEKIDYLLKAFVNDLYKHFVISSFYTETNEYRLEANFESMDPIPDDCHSPNLICGTI